MQPFTAWQDMASYVLAPGGNIEAGTAGWDVAGGAAAVEGNEPFRVGGAADHIALALPPGARATTASMCIGTEHRTMRFFARGAARSALDVDVIYNAPNGRPLSIRLGTVAGTGAWAPTSALSMVVNWQAVASGNALNVNLRFTPRGASSWTIDDVYVDPYRGR